MKTPIEDMNVQDLQGEWQGELGVLRDMEKSNPDWEWQTVQRHLERLHALAQELRQKKSLDQAKWQP